METRNTLENIDREELRRRLDEALRDQETAKGVLTIGGAAMAIYGVTRLTPLGAVLAMVGGGLVYLGQQNRSFADLARDVREMTAGLREPVTIDVEKTVTVNRPREEVYAFWRNFENLARFMRHIESVEVLGDKRSRWSAALFRGAPVAEWYAETIEEVANERISWRSEPGSVVETHGTVRFDSVMGGRGTEVRLMMEYRTPGGAVGAKLLNPAISSMIKEDLRRFKQMLESGEEATVTGQPSGRTGSQRFEFE